MKYFCLIGLLLLCDAANAENRLRFRAATESGFYFHETQSAQLVSGLNTTLDYKKMSGRNRFYIKGRLAPRYYFEDGLSIVRLSSGFDFQRSISEGTFSLSFFLNKNWYDGERFSPFSYRIFKAGSAYTHRLNRNSSMTAEAGFFSRAFSNDYFNSLDGFSLRLASFISLYDKIRLSLGIHAERFLIQNQLNPSLSPENNGYRFGPEIGLSLRSDYILSLSFLYNNQEYDHFSVSDRNYHLILLFGRYLTQKLTLFFYINIYQGTESETIPWELTYKPISNENYYYLKLGYDISRRREMYVKFGYQREEFFSTNQTLSGTQVVAGFTLSR